MTVAEIYSSYMYSYPHKTAYRTLSSVAWNNYKHLHGANNLYFHIPFCETKCGYCNLFSVTGKQDDYFKLYIDAMEQQIQQYDLHDNKIKHWDTFTIGGGTPLILPDNLLQRLFSMAQNVMGSSFAESYGCIETSPNQTTESKVRILKDAGINRVSIGVQSFIDDELKALGRKHSPKSASESLSVLKNIGIECVNIDLIYGIQGQTISSLQYSIDKALDFAPDEIFIYPLYIRKGTGMYKSGVVNSEAYNMYLFLRNYLQERGYTQTSMRRFCLKPNNSNASCGFDNTISIGCGGRSYIGNLHFCTPYSSNRADCVRIIDEFIEQPSKIDITHGYLLNEDEQKRRFVIKNLLFVSGLSEEDYFNRFNADMFSDFSILKDFIAKNYCEYNNRRICLTPLGMSLSDHIGPMFISPEVTRKMNEWNK